MEAACTGGSPCLATHGGGFHNEVACHPAGPIDGAGPRGQLIASEPRAIGGYLAFRPIVAVVGGGS